MSEVKADDQTEIKNADEIAHLYSGSGSDVKSGIEVELAFFNPKTPDLDAMSLAQNKVLKNSAMAVKPDSDWVHNEPTSELLEAASIACPMSQMKDVMADVNEKIKILHEKSEGLGLKRSYFQELPEKTADDLLSRIVDVERYNIMYAPYRDDMKKCVEYFAICKSNQVSASYQTSDHLLHNVRRLYILAPFLFLLTDNSVGFMEGKPFDGHVGMHLRHRGLTEGRGGVPPYIFSARTGDEFVQKHIDHVMNNPLFMYYGLEGELNRVPSGDWGVTFNSLRDRGLNTASNYYLAQSIMWPDVKIAALKDAQGAVTGHRYEARMFGVGAHQHQTAFILTTALAFDEGFAAEVDELLMRYALENIDSKQTQKHVQDAYNAAKTHDGKFFDIPYGNGIMADFAKEMADLIEEVAERYGIEKEALPMLTICRTGCTDAKVNRLLFPTLSDVLEFQKSYDMNIFNDPNQCARMLFENKISEHSDNPCIAVSAA